MEKKITVYVVRESVQDGEEKKAVDGGKEKAYATKRAANEASEILNDFGVEVSVFAEKRVVTL